MPSILGLLESEKFAAERPRNFRREILHQFPQGAAPITGLLSFLSDEVTSDPEFFWYEQRFLKRRTTLRGTNPITTTAPSSATADDGTGVGAGARAITVDLWIKVNDADRFNQNLLVQLDKLDTLFVVLEVVVDSSGGKVGFLKVRLIRAFTFVTADIAAGNHARIVGSAHHEGGSGSYGSMHRLPQRIMNSTEIFRTEFEFSGTSAKTETWFDKTGPYKEQAQDAHIRHMTDIEKSLLFGMRSLTTATDPTTGRLSTRRTFSGIIEHLRLWDAGASGLEINGSSYNPYNDHSAVTSDSDDLKRVIENSDGTMSRRKWLEFVERVGRYHGNRSADKLVVCGSGAYMTFQELFDKSTQQQVRYGEQHYGLDFIRYITPFGNYYFMTHPLFNDDPLWRNWALILDVHSMKWRYLDGRDTHMRKRVQLPNEDLRRDELLTEAGFEFWLPESNMLIKNVSSFVSS